MLRKLSVFGSLMLVFTAAFASKITPEQMAFINSTSAQYKIPKQELIDLFNKAQVDQRSITSITHPYEKKPWDVYRKFFLTQTRIDKGVAYWKKHQAALQKIHQQYGVPISVIVAIAGIETNYGEHIGDFSAFNSLYTLSFYYKPREAFFRNELSQLILMSQRDDFDPIKLKSSYAGALGIPQFMPSAYHKYAVQFDKSSKIDILNNDDDALASIANYLKGEHWQPNQPIATQFTHTQPIQEAWVSSSARAHDTIGSWEQRGLKPFIKTPPTEKAALITLTQSAGKPVEYWLVYPNFRVIMSYNPRVTYAMAVFQLSEALEQAYNGTKSSPRKNS